MTDGRNRRPQTIEVHGYERREAGRDQPGGGGLAAHFDGCARRGVAAARAMAGLKRGGFVPDVVLAHPGWGEALFVRDVFPDARLVLQAEHFYDPEAADLRFDPEFVDRAGPRDLGSRTRNATMLVSFAAADLLVSPTRWQASRFPALFRDRIRVLHEGILTEFAKPDPTARLTFARDAVTVGAGDEIVTFVNRNLEPYRGFHTFMRALPDILRARPRARAVIVGGDGVSYGRRAPDGRSWKSILVSEVRDRLPMDRVHFVGRVGHGILTRLLQISAAHVYLTYPFVLSWSMLEAMSAGAYVVGSRTEPVQEVITDGRNGRLVDFFDPAGLAEAVIEALDRPHLLQDIRAEARETIVEHYDFETRCLPEWMRLVGGD